MFQSSEGVPDDVLEEARGAIENLLPSKSKEKYDFAYKRFEDWCKSRNVASYSECVLLAYFAHLSKTMKSSTLWSQYSMVKATLSIKNGVQIDRYSKLRAFLKRKNEGYTPKKSLVLTSEQVEHFINEAPDNKYLMIKVNIKQ